MLLASAPRMLVEHEPLVKCRILGGEIRSECIAGFQKHRRTTKIGVASCSGLGVCYAPDRAGSSGLDHWELA